MIIESTVRVSFPESLPKDRQDYYLKLINDFHYLINLSIENELELLTCFPSYFVDDNKEFKLK